MSFLLPRLETKQEVDAAIRDTEDLVLVLRFGRENDSACLQLDNVVSGPHWASIGPHYFGRHYLCRSKHSVDCEISVRKLAKAVPELAKMAAVFTVDADKVPVYVRYFDITLIPATVFFFNAQHMKVDWGRPDNTKFIGSFKTKQDFIDVVETIFRGAMKGKVMVTSPLDPSNVPKYDLIYKDI